MVMCYASVYGQRKLSPPRVLSIVFESRPNILHSVVMHNFLSGTQLLDFFVFVAKLAIMRCIIFHQQMKLVAASLNLLFSCYVVIV